MRHDPLPGPQLGASADGEPSKEAASPPAALHLSPLQLSALAAVLVGYAALSHYSNSTPSAKGLGAALSVGPVLLIGAVLTWRWAGRLIAAAATAIAGVFIYRHWAAFENNYEWGDLVQQCGVYALVALSFARTLGSGRLPLCTRLAVELHGPLAPLEITYTRRATLAWAIFYFLIAAAVAILFFAAPLRVWSIFVNFATLGLIALMYIADHVLRHYVLPRREPVNLRKLLQRILVG